MEIKEIIDKIYALPVVIPEKGVLAGPAKADTICSVWDDAKYFETTRPYLTYGIGGTNDVILRMVQTLAEGEEKDALMEVYEVYTAILSYLWHYIEKYWELGTAAKTARDADETDRVLTMSFDMRQVISGKPNHLRSAVATFFVMHVIRTALGGTETPDLDRHLAEFYEKDIKSGTVTDDEAIAIFSELKARLAEGGDDLSSLVSGEGKLSELMLKA